MDNSDVLPKELSDAMETSFCEAFTQELKERAATATLTADALPPAEGCQRVTVTLHPRDRHGLTARLSWTPLADAPPGHSLERDFDVLDRPLTPHMATIFARDLAKLVPLTKCSE